MKALVFRDDGIKIGSFVDLLENETQEHPVAILSALGEYVVTWIQYKLFDTRPMILVKVETAE